ncbi:MAG: SPOR domain-containing protein [Syntrophales bacterium]|nr:SPOR domain-containing protein [Syntrophales bacterium]
MKAKNTRPFELKLGKMAIVLTIMGFSVLVFLSFLLGVKVGMNIETYPKEIAWGIPAKVVRLLGLPRSPGKVEVPPIVPAPSVPTESESPPTAREVPSPTAEPVKSAISPSTEIGKTALEAPPAPGAPVVSEEPVKSAEPPLPKTGKAAPEGVFIVQVGSFKDERKAREVSGKIKSLGFQSRIRTVDITGKGRWHQVTIERFTSKAEAEKAMEKVMAQIKGLDCVIRRVDRGQ